MNKEEIKKFINSFSQKQDRTIVIVDYGNVEKWKFSLKWKVGIKELGQLVKNFSNQKTALWAVFDQNRAGLLPTPTDYTQI
jgi:hypothetical protein